MTCWRKPNERMKAGVWQRIHKADLRRREHEQILWIELALTLPASRSATGVHTPKRRVRITQLAAESNTAN